MEEVTRKLLEECSKGCRMAVSSMSQVSSHVSGDKLGNVINDYRRRHEQLGKKADDLLTEGGARPKDPPAAASAFSWVTAEMKMTLKDDNSQISKLMMDGCNMGIQSISKAMNENAAASGESLTLAGELVRTEEEFMKELREFL